MPCSTPVVCASNAASNQKSVLMDKGKRRQIARHIGAQAARDGGLLIRGVHGLQHEGGRAHGLSLCRLYLRICASGRRREQSADQFTGATARPFRATPYVTKRSPNLGWTGRGQHRPGNRAEKHGWQVVAGRWARWQREEPRLRHREQSCHRCQQPKRGARCRPNRPQRRAGEFAFGL